MSETTNSCLASFLTAGSNKNYHTAAYVAVATSVSELLARIPTEIIDANSVTAIETVIKLFVLSL